MHPLFSFYLPISRYFDTNKKLQLFWNNTEQVKRMKWTLIGWEFSWLRSILARVFVKFSLKYHDWIAELISREWMIYGINQDDRTIRCFSQTRAHIWFIMFGFEKLISWNIKRANDKTCTELLKLDVPDWLRFILSTRFR